MKKWLNFLPALMLLPIVAPLEPIAAQTTAPRITEAAPRPTSAIPGESPYDQYMRLGYAAAKASDPDVALIYFRNALYMRPGDRLATIAYWNMVDQMENPRSAPTAQSEPAQPRPTASTAPTFDRYMRTGYEATEQGDYQTALINFRRALQERPGNPYARQAIRNVETYIERDSDSAQRLPVGQRTLEGESIGGE